MMNISLKNNNWDKMLENNNGNIYENVEKAKYTDYLREGVMDFFLLKGADE